MRSVLFSIFGFPIHSYGLMMVVGFMFGIWRASRRAQSLGINPNWIADIGLYSLIAGILGARILYGLLNIRTESLANIYKIWEGGLSFHGGILFGILAAWIYCRRRRLEFWTVADLCAPSIAAAYAFTRVGCFLNGCCYGAPTDLPWGVRFLENGNWTPPSHPTQLYAAFANLLIFWILTRVEKLEKPTGSIFAAYVALYGVYRFVVEHFRKGFSAEVFWLNLTQAQWVSLAMLLVGAAFYIKLTREKR